MVKVLGVGSWVVGSWELGRWELGVGCWVLGYGDSEARTLQADRFGAEATGRSHSNQLERGQPVRHFGNGFGSE